MIQVLHFLLPLLFHFSPLTLKAPITTAADDYFYFIYLLFFFSEKAKQTIHMKCQDLFSLKNQKKRNITECHLPQSLLGALRVNSILGA